MNIAVSVALGFGLAATRPAGFVFKYSRRISTFFYSDCFKKYIAIFEEAYLKEWECLMDIDMYFIFYWFKTYRNRKSNWNYFIIITICYLLFIIISDMPSAFLNLNIGWILIPVLLISSYQLQKENNV